MSARTTCKMCGAPIAQTRNNRRELCSKCVVEKRREQNRVKAAMCASIVKAEREERKEKKLKPWQKPSVDKCSMVRARIEKRRRANRSYYDLCPLP